MSRSRYEKQLDLTAQIRADLAADLERSNADLKHERERVAEAHKHTQWFINETARLCDRLTEQDKRYDALLEKYHALKLEGHALPAPPQVDTSPASQLGPLTRAALAAMSQGMAGANRRAMYAKAIALYTVDYRNDDRRDELTAIAVRQGEIVTL